MCNFDGTFQCFGIFAALGGNKFVDLCPKRNILDARDAEGHSREDRQSMSLYALGRCKPGIGIKTRE
jgi:hypothetical protein